MLPRIGDVVADKYRIDAVIGRGGMSVVYLATHLELDQHVALKVLSAAALLLPEYVVRLKREARAVSHIRSEHVARVYDIGMLEGANVPYLGYTFSAAWAARNPETLASFLAASRQARGILARSDDEWRRLAPLTGASGEAELIKLRDWYRAGMPRKWGTDERDAAAKLFALLARIGGPALVGPIDTIPPGTFWPSTWRESA